MLLKYTLNEDWHKQQLEIAGDNPDAQKLCRSYKKLLEESNDEHGFSFLAPHLAMYLQTALRDGNPQPFNETTPDDRFSVEDYGYAESIKETVQYLKNVYGDDNPDAFVVEASVITDYEKLYKNGSFIKNGVDTEESYHRWFDENGGEPECELGKTEDGRYIFVHFVVWRKTA